MLEQYCCESLRNMCRDVIDNHNPPILRLKADKTEFQENPYKNFLGEYRFLWMRSVYDRGKGNRCKRHDMARRWFDQNSPILIMYFFSGLYRGDIENAMKATGNFEKR